MKTNTNVFTTPSEVVSAAALTGTRKEQISQKRAAISEWLATSEGQAYLEAVKSGTAGVDSYNKMVLEQAGLRDVHEQKGRLTKSARGTWGIAIGNTAAALTMAECVARNLTPGPGND